MAHGGKILVDQLATHGVDTVFQLPGESFLAALDGFFDHPEIRLVTCRQEGGVAMAAEAHAKMTGKPGIAFVTRAPGACNASAGIHVAMQDSTPMILFVGQIDSRTRDREAFQEVDYRQFFGPLAKWVTEIEHADRIPELVAQAFHRATSGRPGPVVVALPEDMLSSVVESAPTAKPYAKVQASADGTPARALLDKAERPMVIVGGGVWSQSAGDQLCAWAERNGVPLVASMRCQSHLNNHSPAFVGDCGIAPNPELIARVNNSDCLLVLGARMGEMTTSNWTLLDIPATAQTLIHVYPGPDELGRIYTPDLSVLSSPVAFVESLVRKDLTTPKTGLDQARASFEAWTTPVPTKGALRMEEVIPALQNQLDAEAVICTGAGNYAVWSQRYYRFEKYLTQLGCTSGSMGYSLPAAVAAKIAKPEAQVIAFAGDGCFHMNSQELSTMVEQELGIVIIVVNNGQYGTIRMHQAGKYPGRISGTQMRNPDFAALARAHGGQGETITETAQFAPALARALVAADKGQMTLLELQVDPEVITTTKLIGEIENA